MSNEGGVPEKVEDPDYNKVPHPVEIAINTRQFEISLFWRRAMFFWGFIASAFIGFLSTYPNRPIIALGLSCFGAMCSLCWTLVNRGSKYWQESWATKLEGVSDTEIRKLFLQVEKPQRSLGWPAKRFSPSRVTIALSDFTVILWVGILLFQMLPYVESANGEWNLRSCVPIIMFAGTVIYGILIVVICQGKTRSSIVEEPE